MAKALECDDAIRSATEIRTKGGPGYIQARKRCSGCAGATAIKTTRAREMRRQMTPAEAALWSVVRRDGLGAPCRRQHVVRGWIVDFYVPAASLVIELDGGIHHNQRDSDQERDDVMRDLGIEIVRIQNEEIECDLPRVVEQLRAAVRERLSPLRQSDKRATQPVMPTPLSPVSGKP